MNTRDIVRDCRVIRIAETHARYVPEMEKHFEVYWGAVVPREEKSMMVSDFSAPTLHTYRHNGLQFHVSSLPEEPDAVEGYFRHAPARRKLAFDIGAYCGLSTYELSKRFDKVVAFEPDGENRACLVANVIRHSLDNVLVVASAVTHATGKTQFFSEGNLGSRLALHEYSRGPIREVNTISLADACYTYGTPDFVTMDIEAAEIQVLDSSRPLLRQCQIAFAIDTNHEESKGWTWQPVEAILKDCGYLVETDTPGGFFTTWGWKE